nr:tRNA lysidine(34) synthetase TilS [Larsenimonas salina]
MGGKRSTLKSACRPSARGGSVTEHQVQPYLEHGFSISGACVWVALSGGMDSACLLHLAHRFCPARTELKAVHVNHGLHAEAGALEAACERQCQALGIELVCHRVTVDPDGDGLEAAARRVRYAAFEQTLEPGDTLWLAHHCDDQAETVLLRLLRGSGLTGLGGMAPKRALTATCALVRPLLSVPRASLVELSENAGLVWAEDPTNRDTRFDRNFLRHDVLPRLEARWTRASHVLASTAELLRGERAALMRFADEVLERITCAPGVLELDALVARSPDEQAVLIRCALAQLEVPLPPRRRLATLLKQLDARPDAEVVVKWPGGEARQWRRRVYLGTPCAELAPFDAAWENATELTTPWGDWFGALSSTSSGKAMIDRVTSRRGGERLRVNGHRRALKALFQTYEVPPWQRSQSLFVWAGGELVALVLPPGATPSVLTADGWTCEASRWRDRSRP